MLEPLKAIFKKLTTHEEELHFEENDHRVAASALLIHVMYSDGFVKDSEKKVIHDALQNQYGLGEDELKELMKVGEKADHDAVDFYTFTSVLKRNLDREGCKKIVEMMWEVVLADGYVHELEDTVMWRVAELLGIETRERVALRKKAEENLKNSI